MKRKRCPNCQSLHTKKQGCYKINASTLWGKRQRKIQRYYCLDCQSTFSKRAEHKGYPPSLVLKAADNFMSDRIRYFSGSTNWDSSANLLKRQLVNFLPITLVILLPMEQPFLLKEKKTNCFLPLMQKARIFRMLDIPHPRITTIGR